MKAIAPVVKKCLSIAFLVIYFFISSTYVFYLSRYNPYISAIIPGPAHAAHYHSNEGSQDPVLQFHKAFKSITENKRTIVPAAFLLASLFISFIFNANSLNSLVSIPGRRLKPLFRLNCNYYLNFCVLRI